MRKTREIHTWQAAPEKSGSTARKLESSARILAIERYKRTRIDRDATFSLELYTKMVFFGRYRAVFLGIYHTYTEGKLGQYFRYQKIGGSPSNNWREPPFTQEGGASAPSSYTLPSF